MPLTCWIPVPPDIYWAREWAEEAAPMLYRHGGLPYTGRIVGQRHDVQPICPPSAEGLSWGILFGIQLLVTGRLIYERDDEGY